MVQTPTKTVCRFGKFFCEKFQTYPRVTSRGSTRRDALGRRKRPPSEPDDQDHATRTRSERPSSRRTSHDDAYAGGRRVSPRLTSRSWCSRWSQARRVDRATDIRARKRLGSGSTQHGAPGATRPEGHRLPRTPGGPPASAATPAGTHSQPGTRVTAPIPRAGGSSEALLTPISTRPGKRKCPGTDPRALQCWLCRNTTGEA